jgi:protoheme IX farnesyltransferase
LKQSLAAIDIAPGKPVPCGTIGETKVQQDGIKPRKAQRNLLASKAGLYWKLSKGKLTVWVALSAMPGYLLAVPGVIDPVTFAALATGTVLTSASAQAMNQIIEVKRDARMGRTAARPLPSGRMSSKEASAFALASSSLGLGVLACGANPATAAIAGATIITYVGAYTPMKVISPYNTHIGAISGSLPTLLGFYAATGAGLLSSPWGGHAIWLFAMQTLWQMPHFYALAWIHRADYIKGGYSMFPLSDATGHKTAAMSKPYLIAMCGMPWVASALGLSSWMLPVGAAVPSYIWWHSLRKFEQNPNVSTCRRFFLGSLSYLLATLALFTAYGRAQKPALTSEESTDDAAARAHVPLLEVGTSPLEPAWRARFATWFSEFCPHEQMRFDIFGALGSSCPFGGTKTLAEKVS